MSRLKTFIHRIINTNSRNYYIYSLHAMSLEGGGEEQVS